MGLLVLAGAASAEAASLQTIGSFNAPMYVTSPPNEADRLLVAQRGGRIEQVREGVISNFADLEPVVGCCTGERGLQSIAVAPDFATTGRFFVFYTDDAGNLRVGEMRQVGTTAPLTTLRDVLTIPHPEEANHNGGQLQFGPEGLLYVSTGDGGGQDDEHKNAQNPESLLGKILRIDPRPSGLASFTVPPGNPIAGSPVWSIGLRNPYRFSFDSAGGMLIGDVGQGEVEEVDYAPASAPPGANYGWNCFEGTLPGPPAADPECATLPPGAVTPPIFQYPHADPGDGGAFGQAIIGGYVVRDRSLGDLFGRYVYSDYAVGLIRSFVISAPAGSDRSEGLTIEQPTSFGEDSCGRLYVMSEAGRVARLTGASPAACPLASAEKLQQTFVGIRAQSRRVKRNKKALITVFVSPCKGRKGNAISLFRGARRIGRRHLDGVCSARFRPRISRRAKFRATVVATSTYEAGFSRKLTIKPRKKQRGR